MSSHGVPIPKAGPASSSRRRRPAAWSRIVLVAALATMAAPVFADDDTATTDRPYASSTLVDYHGFRIDTGRPDVDIDATDPALARQVAIVEALDVPPAVAAFFRSVPIRAEATLPTPPGQFVGTPRGGFVRILASGTAPDRPILLHELLHAYHADVLGRDARIADAYAQARRSGAYPPRFLDAHFLANPKEFFAVTASLYLFGPIKQPPFDCRVLRETQPDYLAFLAERFGPHECR